MGDAGPIAVTPYTLRIAHCCLLLFTIQNRHPWICPCCFSGWLLPRPPHPRVALPARLLSGSFSPRRRTEPEIGTHGPGDELALTHQAGIWTWPTIHVGPHNQAAPTHACEIKSKGKRTRTHAHTHTHTERAVSETCCGRRHSEQQDCPKFGSSQPHFARPVDPARGGGGHHHNQRQSSGPRKASKHTVPPPQNGQAGLIIPYGRRWGRLGIDVEVAFPSPRAALLQVAAEKLSLVAVGEGGDGDGRHAVGRA
jgi:hypothetical protein